jgi:hypothetical protein
MKVSKVVLNQSCLIRIAHVFASAAPLTLFGAGGCDVPTGCPEAYHVEKDQKGDDACRPDTDAAAGAASVDSSSDTWTSWDLDGGLQWTFDAAVADTALPGTHVDASSEPGTERDAAFGTATESDAASSAPAAPACAPAAEVCGDGKDSDCDGVVDNGVTNACGGCTVIDPAHAVGAGCSNGGQGICSMPGTYQCVGGTTVCNAPSPTPSTEMCDGKDNDCDGVADNGVLNACGGCGALAQAKDSPCSNGLMGECAATGVYTCTPAKDAVVCNAPMKVGTAEVCGDGKDNDCDGIVDNGVTKNACGGCAPLANAKDAECAAGVGACRSSGVYMCASNNEATACSATPKAPSPDFGFHPAGTSADLNCDGVEEKEPMVTAFINGETVKKPLCKGSGADTDPATCAEGPCFLPIAAGTIPSCEVTGSGGIAATEHRPLSGSPIYKCYTVSDTASDTEIVTKVSQLCR